MASCLYQTFLAHLNAYLLGRRSEVGGRRSNSFFHNVFSLHTRRTTSPQYEIWDFAHDP